MRSEKELHARGRRPKVPVTRFTVVSQGKEKVLFAHRDPALNWNKLAVTVRDTLNTRGS